MNAPPMPTVAVDVPEPAGRVRRRLRLGRLAAVPAQAKLPVPRGAVLIPVSLPLLTVPVPPLI